VLGGKDSEKFKEFVQVACEAYEIVKKNSKRFIDLFAMMISAGTFLNI
jgi:hypothetical protein